MSVSKAHLRTLVRGAYDIQKLRVQSGNRIIGNFKAKLGQKPSQKEEEGIDEEGQEILKDLRERFLKITNGAIEKIPTIKEFKGDEIISSYTELFLISEYLCFERQENEHFKLIKAELKAFPIFNNFLYNIKGIGPAMAGVIISEFDITRAKYASSLCKYAGLSVEKDGYGTSSRSEHLVLKPYTAKNGEEKERWSLQYNPFLKTKLMGVLAGSFLKCKNETYSQVYYDYKTRMENHIKYGTHNDNKKEVYPPSGKNRIVTSKLRRHRMACRKMIKIFLIDLYKAWRPLEGLEVHPPYAEAKLGRFHNQKDPEPLPKPEEPQDEEDDNEDVKE